MERVAGTDRCQKASNAKKDGLQAQATVVVMRESRSRSRSSQHLTLAACFEASRAPPCLVCELSIHMHRQPLGGWANGATLPRPTRAHGQPATAPITIIDASTQTWPRSATSCTGSTAVPDVSNQRPAAPSVLTPSMLDGPHCAPATRVSSRPLLAVPRASFERAALVSHRKSNICHSGNVNLLSVCIHAR